MRAWETAGTGTLQLVERPVPRPGGGEVLVAAVARQCDEPDRRIGGPNSLRDLAAIDAGQTDIDEREPRA
jgi:hypothetical protein